MLQHMRDAIRLVKADLVLLQEVVGENTRHKQRLKSWPSLTQFDYLAEEVWPHVAYGKNAVYSSGHHGNAILSRLPIVLAENTDISVHPLERRGLLHAVLRMTGQLPRLDCLCLHLGLTKHSRELQTLQVISRVRSLVPDDNPLIIAGDFNDWSTRVTAQLSRHLKVKEAFKLYSGHHARTFPSRLPLLKLDRIYCRGFEVKTCQVLTGSPWNILSDHAALYAELELKGKT